MDFCLAAAIDKSWKSGKNGRFFLGKMEILASFLLEKWKYVYTKCRFTAVYQHINNITPTSVLLSSTNLGKMEIFRIFCLEKRHF